MSVNKDIIFQKFDYNKKHEEEGDRQTALKHPERKQQYRGTFSHHTGTFHHVYAGPDKNTAEYKTENIRKDGENKVRPFRKVGADKIHPHVAFFLKGVGKHEKGGHNGHKGGRLVDPHLRLTKGTQDNFNDDYQSNGNKKPTAEMAHGSNKARQGIAQNIRDNTSVEHSLWIRHFPCIPPV